jgi:acyl-coenzyme A thioesterase PaaI-like protein
MQRLAFPLRIPFVEHLDLELWAFGEGQAELRVNMSEAHLNSWRVAHGGVLMTMLDVAMAHAARSGNNPSNSPGNGAGNNAGESAGEIAGDAAGATADQGPGVATVEMKTSFLRPAEGRLRATGKLLHKTVTMAFTEGHVFDEAGKLCAHATGTFKFLRALPTTGRHAKELQRN